MRALRSMSRLTFFFFFAYECPVVLFLNEFVKYRFKIVVEVYLAT